MPMRALARVRGGSPNLQTMKRPYPGIYKAAAKRFLVRPALLEEGAYSHGREIEIGQSIRLGVTTYGV